MKKPMDLIFNDDSKAGDEVEIVLREPRKLCYMAIRVCSSTSIYIEDYAKAKKMADRLSVMAKYMKSKKGK